MKTADLMLPGYVLAIHQLSTDTLIVDSRRLDFSVYYTAQVWERTVADDWTICLLSGRYVYPGDAVFQPNTVLTNRNWCILVEEFDRLADGARYI
jgi:hypothetical protein